MIVLGVLKPNTRQSANICHSQAVLSTYVTLLPYNFLILEANHLPSQDSFFSPTHSRRPHCFGGDLKISECSSVSHRELLGTWIQFWIKLGFSNRGCMKWSATTAFLYPGYASYKTLSQRPASEAELERWLMYWSVLGCIVGVEYLAGWLISWWVEVDSIFKWETLMIVKDPTLLDYENDIPALPRLASNARRNICLHRPSPPILRKSWTTNWPSDRRSARTTLSLRTRKGTSCLASSPRGSHSARNSKPCCTARNKYEWPYSAFTNSSWSCTVDFFALDLIRPFNYRRWYSTFTANCCGHVAWCWCPHRSFESEYQHCPWFNFWWATFEVNRSSPRTGTIWERAFDATVNPTSE